MGEESDGKEGKGPDAGKGPPADGEDAPRLPGIPEPEPDRGAEPLPIPEEMDRPGEDEDADHSAVMELERRLDTGLEARLDREVERGTEAKLSGEIEQGIEERIRKDLELEVDREVGRQMGPAPLTVVDLAVPKAQAPPMAEVLEPAAEKAAPPPEAVPVASAAMNVARRPALKNHRPAAKPSTSREGMVNGRTPGEDGLRNRRGLSNGALNGTGMVNGPRKRAGLSNGNGITNGGGIVNGQRGGTVNGRGRGGILGRRAAVNGTLTDAEATYNGRGMVNGRGIVNGEGITNGRKLAIGESAPRPRRSTGRVMAAIFAVAILVVVIAIIGFTATEKGIRVDGVFSDWSGVKKYRDSVADQDNPDINIREYALELDGTSASFYVRMEGKALGGRNGGVDSVYFFIDADQSEGTGYRIDSVGAEYVLVTDGFGGRVSAAGLYRFPREGGRPHNDWNSRSAGGSCRAAAAGGELEVQTSLQDIGLQAGAKVNVFTLAKDTSGGEDWTSVMSNERVRLTVLWSRVGPETAGPGSSGVPAVRFELSAVGGNATVTSLTVRASEALADADITHLGLTYASGDEVPGASARLSGGQAVLTMDPPLSVHSGSSTIVNLDADIAAGASAGKAFGFSLAGGSDIIANTRAVSVESRSLQMTYIGGQTHGIVIDGAFSDWAGCPDHPDPANDVSDANIDVTGFRLASDPSSLYFYLQVGGAMMGGAGIPEAKTRPPERPSGGGGGPVTLPVLVGEDSVFLFIDTDRDAATGYTGGGLPLGAEYMVNITGQYGRIGSKRLHAFSGGDRSAWSWTPVAELLAATDETRLEAAIAAAALGNPAGNISVYYFTTDWRQKRDAGEKVLFDLRAGGGGRSLPGPGPEYIPPGLPLSERDIQPLHAPEFRDILLPVCGMIAVFALLRKRRRRA